MFKGFDLLRVKRTKEKVSLKMFRKRLRNWLVLRGLDTRILRSKEIRHTAPVEWQFWRGKWTILRRGRTKEID